MSLPGVFLWRPRLTLRRALSRRLGRRAVLRALLEAGSERAAVAEGGRVVAANAAFAAFLGYTPDELRGRLLTDLYTADGEPVEVGEGLPAVREATVALRGGKTLPAEVAVRPLELGGRALELVALRDPSAQLGTQTALRRYQAELERQNRALERSDRIKSEFLATISHELRTPLTSVIGYAQLLEADPALSPEAQGYLKLVQASGRQLIDLVEGLIDLSKLEAGELPLYRQNVPFGAVLTQALARVEAAAADKGLTVSVFGSAAPTLYADAPRLEQILGAYLSNAVKFTPLGGLVEVSLSVDAGEFRCEIRDDGIGVAPDDLPHVFQPFFRVGDFESRTESGAGLGLALAKRLCELHGGRVWAESTLGRGSRFGFALPLHRPAEGPGEQPRTGSSGPS